MKRLVKGERTVERSSLSELLASILESVVLVAGTVSLVLLFDYIVIKRYFESVLNWNFAHTFSTAVVFESITFFPIGIRFLREKVEQHREHYTGNRIMPDMVRIPRYEVIHKARPKFGRVMIGAGIVLFIIGMFIIPSYYNL